MADDLSSVEADLANLRATVVGMAKQLAEAHNKQNAQIKALQAGLKKLEQLLWKNDKHIEDQLIKARQYIDRKDKELRAEIRKNK